MDRQTLSTLKSSVSAPFSILHSLLSLSLNLSLNQLSSTQQQIATVLRNLADPGKLHR